MGILFLQNEILLRILWFLINPRIFIVSKTCNDLVDRTLQEKFNIKNDEKKIIVNIDINHILNKINLQTLGHAKIFLVLRTQLCIISSSNMEINRNICHQLRKNFKAFTDIFDITNPIHYGIPFNKNTIFLDAIKHKRMTAINFVLENNVQIKSWYLFEVIKNCSIFENENIQLTILKKLIEKGADPYYIHNNKNLLEYAFENNNGVIIDYLTDNFEFVFVCPNNNFLFEIVKF